MEPSMHPPSSAKDEACSASQPKAAAHLDGDAPTNAHLDGDAPTNAVNHGGATQEYDGGSPEFSPTQPTQDFTPSQDSPFHPLVEGMRLSKYRVTARLAQGGFSSVFEARNETTGQLVAIKVSTKPMRVDTRRPQALRIEQLRQHQLLEIHEIEFDAYRKLDYGVCSGGAAPCIPRFYESGYLKLQSGPRPHMESVHTYFVMELLGPSLGCLSHCRCERDPMLREHACSVHNRESFFAAARSMLGALEAIHKKGLVHRDIKPHNFCFRRGPGSADATSDKPQLCIIDLGYAKAQPQSLEEAGEHDYFVGTPDYASVNALCHVRQGPRDDIESLGYSFLELYNGVLPWDLAPPPGKEWSRALMIETARTKDAAWSKLVRAPEDQADSCLRGAGRGQQQRRQAAADAAATQPFAPAPAHVVPGFIQAWVKYARGLSPLLLPNYVYLQKLLEDGEREADEAGDLQPRLTTAGKEQEGRVRAEAAGAAGGKGALPWTDDMAGKEAWEGGQGDGGARSLCGMASNSEGAGGEGLGSWGGGSQRSCSAGPGGSVSVGGGWGGAAAAAATAAAAAAAAERCSGFVPEASSCGSGCALPSDGCSEGMGVGARVRGKRANRGSGASGAGGRERGATSGAKRQRHSEDERFARGLLSLED